MTKAIPLGTNRPGPARSFPAVTSSGDELGGELHLVGSAHGFVHISGDRVVRIGNLSHADSPPMATERNWSAYYAALLRAAARHEGPENPEAYRVYDQYFVEPGGRAPQSVSLDWRRVLSLVGFAPVQEQGGEVHLKRAMAELDDVRDMAKEEGYLPPTRPLVAAVKRLIRRIIAVAPIPYSIYPMEDGEVAIHASNEPIGAVVITCLPHDTRCIVSIGQSRRRAWFQDMEELPDPFTRKALRDLQGVERHE